METLGEFQNHGWDGLLLCIGVNVEWHPFWLPILDLKRLPCTSSIFALLGISTSSTRITIIRGSVGPVFRKINETRLTKRVPENLRSHQ